MFVCTGNGDVLASFGRKSKEGGGETLQEPLYVHVDHKERVLVSDRTQCCIKVYSLSGEFLGKFGSSGTSDGHLLSPHGLCEDAFGNILVCDTENKRVTAFDRQGHFIKHLLTATDGVTFPVDVTFDSESGHLAVSMHHTNGTFRKIRVYKIPSRAEAQKKGVARPQ